MTAGARATNILMAHGGQIPPSSADPWDTCSNFPVIPQLRDWPRCLHYLRAREFLLSNLPKYQTFLSHPFLITMLLQFSNISADPSRLASRKARCLSTITLVQGPFVPECISSRIINSALYSMTSA